MSEKASRNQILELFDVLNEEDRKSLIDFAEFLSSKSTPLEVIQEEPLEIERPDDETVVGAIKRLKQTYPMIESMSVFSAASSLMMEHMVNGRPTKEVIDEMQVLFEESYQKIIKVK